MAPDINESKSLFDSFGTLDEIDDSENYFEEKKPPTLPPLWLYPFYGFSGSEIDCQTKKPFKSNLSKLHVDVTE